jgi:hypothetical protein
MLDLVEFALQAKAIPFQRFDGTMNLKQRSACLDEFRNNSGCQVLLASIQCAGVGYSISSPYSSVFSNISQFLQPGSNRGIAYSPSGTSVESRKRRASVGPNTQDRSDSAGGNLPLSHEGLHGRGWYLINPEHGHESKSISGSTWPLCKPKSCSLCSCLLAVKAHRRAIFYRFHGWLFSSGLMLTFSRN